MALLKAFNDRLNFILPDRIGYSTGIAIAYAPFAIDNECFWCARHTKFNGNPPISIIAGARIRVTVARESGGACAGFVLPVNADKQEIIAIAQTHQCRVFDMTRNTP